MDGDPSPRTNRHNSILKAVVKLAIEDAREQALNLERICCISVGQAAADAIANAADSDDEWSSCRERLESGLEVGS